MLMTSDSLGCALALVMILSLGLVAQQTSFEAPVRLKQIDGTFLDVGDGNGYAAPAWVDVTGDGIRDMLVGQFTGGRIRVYPGVAQEGKQPAFGAPFYLKAASELFSVPMG